MMRRLPEILIHWQPYVAVVLACAALAALGHYLVLEPRREAQAQAIVQEQEAVKLEAKLDLMWQSKQSLSRRLAAAQQKLATKRVKLNPLGNLNSRLAELAELAREHKVHVVGLKPGEPVVTDHYATLDIRLTGNATYPAMAAFLEALEQKHPDVRAAALDLRRGANKATIRLDLRWFASKPMPAPTSEDIKPDAAADIR